MKFLSYIVSGFFALFAFLTSAQNNSLLYKIESADSKPSYLFGTMHVIPDSAYYFPTKAQKILRHSSMVVLEVGDINNMAKAQKLMKLESGSCFDIFTPAQKDSVIEWGAKSLGLSKEVFEVSISPLKPFALLQMGTQDMMSGEMKYVELELIKMVPETPIEGLETLEEQLGFFDAMPDSVLAEMIMQSIRDNGEGEETMAALIKAYMDKDIDKLAELVNGDDPGFDADLLLSDRNANWIPKIQTLTKKDNCFIAVGAGHLGGEKGVIALLKKAGYTVTPIPY